MLAFVNLNEMNGMEVVFAGNFSVASSLDAIKGYWDKLPVIGPKYGYLFDTTRKKLMEHQNLFANSNVNITV